MNAAKDQGPTSSDVERMREALEETRRELYCCAEQLRVRGLPGVAGDSVDRALANSAAVLLSLSREREGECGAGAAALDVGHKPRSCNG